MLGLLFGALGIFAAVKATSYSGASGVYPLALGLALACLGALLSGRALLREGTGPRPLTEHAGRVWITLIVAAGYLALVPLLGFYTASAILVLVMPVPLGFRQPVYLAATAAIFIALVWMIFSLVLGKPLPDGFWSAL